MPAECVLVEKVKGATVKCLACRHYCVIAENHSGICGIRFNDNGTLKLLTYGKAAGLHADPIEKKPLYHFYPGTRILSFGTLGCNFACSFCQNWDIAHAARELKQKMKKDDDYESAFGKRADYGQKLSPAEIVQKALDSHIEAIAFTYNEPTIFFEYAYDTARLAKEKGLKTVFVSNGYASHEALEKIKPYLDAINIDLKAFTDDFYKETCQAKLSEVLNGIKDAHEMGFWMELTTLLIPGKNDSDKEIKQMAEFIKSVSDEIPWHLTAFHPDYKMLDVKRTPVETLERACQIAKKTGLKYVYVGNVYENEKSNTHCPKCNELLVKRFGFNAMVKGLREGKCVNCQSAIPGRWEK